MRNLTFMSVSALVLGFASGGTAVAQTEAAPSQTTVQKSDGSVQTEDRSHQGTVTVDGAWKAQGGEKDQTGSVKAEEGHETTGRDWRAHPDNRDR